MSVRPSDYRVLLQDRLILRVSVLDLDNSCRFNKAYIRASEEKRRIRMLSAARSSVTLKRSSRYFGRPTVLLIVISINDVKPTDDLLDASPIGRWNCSYEQLKGQIELFDLWMNEETVTLLRFVWKATAVTTTFLLVQNVSWWSLGGSNS